MRKKMTLVLISLVLVVCSITLFVACGHTHTYGAWTITTEPTKDAEGWAQRVCADADCGDKEIVAVPVLTDSSVWTVAVDPATDSENGKETYTSEYGTVVVVIPALGHNHVFDQKVAEDKFICSQATCTDKAKYYYSCSCGEKGSETFENGNPLGHTFGDWVDGSPATCSAEGVKGHKDCSICNKHFDNEGVEIADLAIEIDANAHTFGTWVDEAPASCTAEGVKAHKDCTICNKHFDNDGVEITDLALSKIEHNYVEVVDESHLKSSANCQSPAVYYKSCSVCHANGTDTFTNGEIGTHTLVEGICAVCKKIKVTVDKHDGSDMTIDYVVANTVLGDSVLPDLTREGYRFLGWFSAGVSFDVDTPITSSVVIEAGWADYSGFENKNYRYAYTTNGGVTLNYSTADYNIATNEFGIATVVGGSTSAPVYPNSTLSFAWLDKDNGLAFITEKYSYSDGDDDEEMSWESTSNVNAGTRYFLALVDSASGIILRSQYSSNSLPTANTAFDVASSAFMLVPTSADVEAVTADDYKGSKLDSQTGWRFIISYKDTTIYISDDDVYFGVTVNDITGTAVSADAVNKATTLVISKGSEVIVRFGLNDNKFAVLDQYAGYYTKDETTLTISGLGILELAGKIGTYTPSNSADYTLDVYFAEGDVNIGYARVTLSGSNYTIDYPTATVTFVSNEEGTTAPDAEDYNINIAHTLPTIDHTATRTFKGWALQDGTVVANPYVVTENVTLTAVWMDKVVVNIINPYGDVDTLYLGDGDVIGDYLDDCIGESDQYMFVGWVIDMNENGTIDNSDIDLSAEAIVSAEDSGITLIAKWADIPVYVGNYTGSILRNNNYTYGSSKTLNINTKGEISGTYNGTVVSYADGKIIWKDSDLAQHTFLFDEDAEIIVYFVSEDGFDYAVFGKNLSADGKVILQNGINAPLPGKEDSIKTCAQFILMDTALGDSTPIFYYGDILLSDPIFKNAKGEVLALSNVSSSDSVVVYDGEEVVFALVAPKGVASLSATDTYGDKAPIVPDSYFGVYTLEDSDNFVVKGNGTFVWGDKSGDYKAIDKETISAYVVVNGENKEYYEVVLADGEYLYELVNVNVTYVSDVTPVEGVPSVASVNKNIAYTLPVLTSADHVFRGWMIEGDDNVYTTLTPTASVTLTAKWDVKYSLTVVYGNGIDNAVLYYGAGDTTVPVEPDLTNGKVFDYWYLSNDGGVTEGDAYIPGAINANTTIYAAWTEPPIYMGSYYGATFYYHTKSSPRITSNALVFDKNGNALPDGTIFSNSSSYKNGSVKLNVLDEVTGKISIVYKYDYVSSSMYDDYMGDSEETVTPTTRTYYGFIDFNSGIIVINTTDNSEVIKSVHVLIPTDTKPASSAFKSAEAWDDQLTKPILYTGEEGFAIFYTNGVVHFGVKFFDQNGAVSDLSTGGLTKLTVKSSANVVIGEYGYMNNKFITLDGHQGSYTGSIEGASHTFVFDGMGYFICSDCDVKGSYEKVGDNFDIYTLDEDSNKLAYYVFTLSDGAFTAEKPMVSITYVTEYDQDNVTNAQVNKNIPTTLVSGLTDDDHVFMGWYVQGDENQAIVTTVTPTADTTYVAKWLDKVALTVVYGNDLENQTHSFNQGANVDLDDYIIIYANGKKFVGWFADADLTTEITRMTIEADTTVYAKWIEHEPYTIIDSKSYAWDRTGEIWKSGNAGHNNTESTITIEVYVDTVISFKYACESENSTKWDYFHIDINGVQKVTAGGGKSNTNNIDTFKEYSVTLNAGDVMALVYQKDSSNYKDADMAVIKDFLIYSVNHTCVGVEVVDDAYIKTSATCQAYAVYYKACSICKNATAETFNGSVYGDHSWSEHECTVCGDEQPKYELTVMTNNGDSQSVDVYHGDNIDFDALTALVGTKTGYYFDGWYSDSSFQNAFELTTITDDVTIYAKWSASLVFNGYKFTGKYYNAYDEYNHNLTLTFTSDTESTLLEGGESYYFHTTYVVDGTKITFTITSCIAGNSYVGKTFIGTLSGNVITFSKGTFYSSNVYTFYEGATVSCADFVAPHSCVYDQETVSEKYLAHGATCIAKAQYYKHCAICDAMGSETFETGEFGLHDYSDGFCIVCHEPRPLDTFTVTFVLGNGSDDITLTITENDSFGENMPADPVKDGKLFVGWFVGETAFSADTVIKSNLTVTASWRDYEPFENNEYRYVSIYYAGKGVDYSTDTYKIATNSAGVATIVGDSTYAPVYPGSTITFSWINKADGIVLIKEVYSYESDDDYRYGGSWGGSSTVSGTRYYWGKLDADTGIIFRQFSSYTSESAAKSAVSTATSMGSSIYMLIPTNSAVDSANLNGGAFKTATNKEWTISYNNGTTTTAFYISGTSIYSGVSFTDLTGTALSAGSGVNDSQHVIVKKGNDVLFSYGKLDSKFVPLDDYHGDYTGSDGALAVDGVGSLTLGELSGDYTATDNDNEIEVYFKDSDDKNIKYAVITLDTTNGTYSVSYPTVAVTYSTAYDQDSVTNADVNKNIEITLPTGLTSDTHVFRGWYLDGDDSQEIIEGTYTPTADVTFVAKWDEKLTLTVVYGNGIDNAVLYYGAGDTVAPVEPEFKDGKAFDHWYLSTDNGATESSVYTIGAITENLTIYCAWKNASPLMGTYKGFEAWGTPTGKGYLGSRSDLVIDAEGKVTSGPGIKGKTADYDSETGTLKFDTYWAYFDSVNGILLYNYSSGGDVLKDDVYVMFKGVDSVTNGTATVTNAMQFAWGKGLNRLIDITVTKNETTTTYIIYIADNKLQKVTIATDVETIDTASEIYSESLKINTLKIYNLAGALIGNFAKSADGKDMLPLDGSEGTYTLDGATDLVLSGTGTATIGENTGSVTAAAEGSTYTYDMYMTESGVKVYYELTIDITAKTYSINKPMVTISFDLGGNGTLDGISVNKNIEVSLSTYAPTYEGFKFKGWYTDSTLKTSVTKVTPTADMTVYAKWNEVLTVSFETEHGEAQESRTYEKGENCYYGHRPQLSEDGYIFRGWYVKGDEEQELVTSAYTVNENTIFVAKWETALILTIVYGKDGYDNAILYVGAGDSFESALNKKKPAQASDGQVFDKWYSDEALTTEFTATSITESTTIYCSWKDPNPYMGTYKGANIYSQNTENKTSLPKTLSIDADGNVIGEGTGLLVENGDSFKYGSRNFDIDNGVCYEDYYANYTLGQGDIYVYFAVKYGDNGNEINPTGIVGCAWNGRLAKLLVCTYSDNSTNTAFYHKGYIYGNVTFEATDADGNAITDVKTIYNTANSFKVYSATGTLICEYAMENGSLVEVVNE